MPAEYVIVVIIGCSFVCDNSPCERAVRVLGVVHHKPRHSPHQSPLRLHRHQLRGGEADHCEQREGGTGQN